MRRVGPRGITTNANRRPPGVAHGPTSRLVAPSSFDGVWKCGNPHTGFPHSHHAPMSFELDSGEPLHRRGEAPWIETRSYLINPNGLGKPMPATRASASE